MRSKRNGADTPEPSRLVGPSAIGTRSGSGSTRFALTSAAVGGGGSDLGWGGDGDGGRVDQHEAAGEREAGLACVVDTVEALDIEAAEGRHRVRLRAERPLDHPDQTTLTDHDDPLPRERGDAP